jgi:hypothetical protein
VNYQEGWRRQHLEKLVARLGTALAIPAHSPVIPLVVGSEQAAVALSNRLLSQGFHVPAIRPPTVPAGTCRLRVSLSAAHSEADVDELVAAVRASGAVLQPLEHLVQAEQVYGLVQQQGLGQTVKQQLQGERQGAQRAVVRSKL